MVLSPPFLCRHRMLLCAASWQGSRNSLLDLLLVLPLALLSASDFLLGGVDSRGRGGEGGGGGTDSRIKLAPRLVRPRLWLSRATCGCACRRVRGAAPACWGGRGHCVSRSFDLAVIVGDSGRGGRGCSEGSVSVVVGVVAVGGGEVVVIGVVAMEMLSGGGDGSLSWMDRSRDAPAQGVGARAAGQGDNDKDLAGQGTGVVSSTPPRGSWFDFKTWALNQRKERGRRWLHLCKAKTCISSRWGKEIPDSVS